MTIIAATDLSTESVSSIQQAAVFAAAMNTDLRCVHVIEDLSDYSNWLLLVESPGELALELKAQAQRQLEQLCSDALAKLPADKRPAVSFEVCDGHVVDHLISLSKQSPGSFISCGSKGRTPLVAGFIGSTPNGLIREADAPLLITPAEYAYKPIEHILVPVDLATPNHQELNTAQQLAAQFNAKISLLYCIQWPSPVLDPLYSRSLDQEFRKSVRASRHEQLEQLAQAANLGDTLKDLIVVEGQPGQQINQASVDHNASLICMATHMRRGIKRFVLGNTAERILRDLAVPALIVTEKHE